MDVNRCWILITFAAYFSLELTEVTCRAMKRADKKYVRKQLFSQTGYILAILEDGEVTTSEHTDDINYTYMHFDSHDTGQVTIKAEKTGYYLCIDDDGGVHSSKNRTKSCEIGEELEESLFLNYYRSVMSNENSEQKLYLAINRHGNVKTVEHRKKSMKFMLKRLES